MGPSPGDSTTFGSMLPFMHMFPVKFVDLQQLACYLLSFSAKKLYLSKQMLLSSYQVTAQEEAAEGRKRGVPLSFPSLPMAAVCPDRGCAPNLGYEKSKPFFASGLLW